MAAPNSNYANALLATTFDNFSPKLYDNVFQSTPTWQWFKNHQDTASGGSVILEHLLYSKGTNAQSFTKGAEFAVVDTDPVTPAQFSRVNYGTAIPIYKQDLMDNSGPAQMLNLAKIKMQQAELDLKDLLATDLWAASAVTGKVLPLPVAIDTTSTVGNLNSTTYSWWQANVDSTVEAVNTDDMVTQYNNCNKGTGGAFPTFGPCGQTFFEGYERLGGLALRLSDGDRARLNLGFTGMWFKDMVLAFDPYMTTGECYMLNEKFIVWRPEGECANRWIHEQQAKADTPGLTLHLIWGRGAITVRRRASLAKITGKTAP